MAHGHTPGGVELQRLNLTTAKSPSTPYNFEQVFRELHIYEDLYSNFITGSISITDSSNIIKNAEITGHESLSFKFKGQNVIGVPASNTDWFELSLCVSGISDRLVTGERQTNYSLDLISNTAYTNGLYKVSQAYTGPVPDIASKVCKDYLNQELFVDVQSTSPFACVIPYWSPVSTVNWLAERCIAANTTGETSDCLFYEDRTGLVLTSLSTLKDAGPMIIDPAPGSSTLYFQPAGAGDSGNPTKQRSVSNYTINPSFKTLEFVETGTYSSQVVSHDITRKKLTNHVPFRSDTDFARRPTLEKYNVVPSSGTVKDNYQFANYPNASYRFQSKNAHLFGEAQPPVQIAIPERWVAQRLSQLGSMKNIVVGVKMPGDTMLKLGDVIRWKNFPSPEQPKTIAGHTVDDFLAGDFLITAIHHIVDPAHYYMLLELTKDSFAKDLS